MNYVNAKTRIRKAGFTLLEIIVVLAIVALLIGSIMRMYQSAQVERNTEESMAELVAIQDAVHNLGSNQSDYGWLQSNGAQTIAQSSLLPTKYLTATGSGGSGFSRYTGIKTAFNTQVDVGVFSGGTGVATNQVYSVTFESIPAAGCTRLATMDLGSGLYQMQIGEVSYGGSSGSANITPTAVNTACGGKTPATIEWDLY